MPLGSVCWLTVADVTVAGGPAAGCGGAAIATAAAAAAVVATDFDCAAAVSCLCSLIFLSISLVSS